MAVAGLMEFDFWTGTVCISPAAPARGDVGCRLVHDHRMRCSGGSTRFGGMFSVGHGIDLWNRAGGNVLHLIMAFGEKL